MNTNFRAILFGSAVAALLTVTMNTVTAAEQVPVVHLDGVTVTAHRDHFDADGNVKVVQLDGVVVTGRKAAVL